MKFYLFIISLFFGLLSCKSGVRKHTIESVSLSKIKTEAEIVDSLQHILSHDSILMKHFIGFKLVDARSKRHILDYNANKLFIPASNIKLFTFLAGLHVLQDSSLSFKYLETGDSIIIKPYGDPSFLNSSLDSIQKAFRFVSQNSKKVFINIPDSNLDYFGSGWAWDDYYYSFQTPKSSFPIYGNQVTFQQPNPSLSLSVIPNHFLASTEYENGDKLIDIYRDEWQNKFKIDHSRIYFPLNKRVPFLPDNSTTLTLLQDTLNREVLSIAYDSEDAIWQNIYNTEMDNLYKLLLRDSDNFVAEQIILMCSMELLDEMNTKAAIAVIQDSIFRNKYKALKWVDGSGLSRYNLASPNSIIDVLEDIVSLIGLEKFKLFLADNTMSSQANGQPNFKKEWIFAKSGSLSNNYNLSGVIETDKNNLYFFSFMNNNFLSPKAQIMHSMFQVFDFIKQNL